MQCAAQNVLFYFILFLSVFCAFLRIVFVLRVLLSLVYLLYLMCICCTLCVFVVSYVYLLHSVCIAALTLDAGLLARSQYPEGPATGHIDTGFLVSLCLQANAEMVPKFPSCYYMPLM